ncbi:MAG: septum formation initiator family protein [Candidatus Omnitrophota bacterium]|nr:septum formation initiator family protein [Candidatus Omnitrophota bacterium]
MIFNKTVPFLGAGLVILIIFLPGYTKIQELRDRNLDLQQKNKVLKKENQFLEAELIRITTDSVYQERILRDKLGVVRKDEVPVKIVPQKE